MMEKGGDSPVLLYKPQGTEYTEVGICNGLREDDFLLVLQTPLQMEMLRSFGNNIICVDATHGTNEYDFMLVSMIVIDDYGEGCPVAWCFTNREDELSLTHFFSHIEQKLSSPIHVQWFMSDDAEQYFSAWMSSFGGNPHKLLSTWHVDRAWRKALSNIISEKSLKVSVYHTLRVLPEELDPKQFNEFLDEAVTQWRGCPQTQSFGKYFTTYYAARPQQWAACHRKQAGINTNMYIHRSVPSCIKVHLLEGNCK